MTAARAPRSGVPAEIDVIIRRPAEIEVHAALARALLAEGKPAGLKRLSHKAARMMFRLVHQLLGQPARASLIPAGASAGFAVDCANTGFLDFARRNRAADGVEPEVSGLVSHLAPRLKVVYDIGANWGFYPLLLGTDPGFAGEIHAFEIGPRTAADLVGVVAGAGLAARVRVHAHGLSDRDGEARLARGRHSYLARLAGADHRGPTEPVAVRRLDALGLPPPQLIKLDVEGHEAAVLRGAATVLDRHHPLIVFESWHLTDRERMLEPLRVLAALGYEFHRLDWRPAGEGRGTVELTPLTPEQRAAIAATLHILAWHRAQAPLFYRRSPPR